MGLTLYTLGRLEIRWQGQPASGVSLRKSQALLVYLALAPGRHDRSHLAGLLWGDLPEQNARRNLRHALHTLRRALAPQVLDDDRLSAGLHPALSLYVDALEFETLITRADRRRRADDLEAAIAPLEAAVELYQGDLLAGFEVPGCLEFEEWTLRRRAQMRQKLLEALDILVEYWTERGAYPRALRHARRQLALEPLRERAHRQMMTLLALTGRRSAALAQYQDCRRTLAQELGVEPLAETTALYRAIQRSSLSSETETTPRPPAPESRSLAFVGRQREHAALVQQWQAARHGAGLLTLVDGEAGVGKTRLLHEVLRYVETEGGMVLRGRCYEFGGHVPYQPIAGALRAYFRGNEIDLSPVWLAELARLLPDLHETHPNLPAPRAAGEAARQRLFEALRRLLSSLCDAHPALALFVDDLHWADQATLDLLHYVVRHLRGTPIWIAGAYRPEETGPSHPLTRLRQGLSRDRCVWQLHVPPLNGVSVCTLAQSLVGERAGQALGDLLYRESEGNAFMLVEMVNALQEEGALAANENAALHSAAQPAWTWTGAPLAETLPRGVRDIVLQRVGRLSAAAQRLLSVVAVVGQPFDAALLNAAAGRDADAVDESLDEWQARRLVHREPATAAYDLSHDKIRAAVYGALTPDRRQQLHQRVGRALEQRFASPVAEHAAALAYHFEQGGVADQALRYLPLAAAEAAAVYANEQALAYCRRALALCPPADERRGPILLQQAEIQILVGAYEAAIAACQQAIEHGSAAVQARAYRTLAQIYRLQRNYAAARRCARESERLIHEGERSNAQRAEALLALAEIEREQTNLARAQALFKAASALYREADDPQGLAHCLQGLAGVSSAQGRYGQARQQYEQAAALFRTLDDKSNASLCLRGIGMACWRQRAYDAARQATLDSLDMCREIGDRQGEAASLNSLGLLAIVRGDHIETQRHLQASVEIYCQLGLEKRAAAGLHNLGISYMECGDAQAARRSLEQALAINRAAGSPRDQALDLGWLGKLHWLWRDHDAAIRCLDRALALDREIGGGEEEDWHLIWRAAVAYETRDLENAQAYVRQAEQKAAQGSANLKGHDIHIWKAHIHLAQGDVAAARAVARQALAQARSGGAPPKTEGEILTLLGRALGTGPGADDGAARAHFEQALALLPDAAPTSYARAMTLAAYATYLSRDGAQAQAGPYLVEARQIWARLGVPDDSSQA